MKQLIILFILLTNWACSKKHTNDLEQYQIEIIATDQSITRKQLMVYYHNQPYNGILREEYSNGIIKSLSSYQGGRLEGQSKVFYQSGKIWQIRYYSNNKKVGIHQGWWENGKNKFYYEFTSGLHDGSLKEWYSNGDLARSFNYQFGKEFGSQKMWNEDRSIRANYVVKNGRRYGLIGLKNCKSISDEKGNYAAIRY